MSQKDARLPVSHKKITGVKKILKETDASGSTATRARIAPTVAAIPTRGAWARVPAYTHSQHVYDFTPQPSYIRFRINPFWP